MEWFTEKKTSEIAVVLLCFAVYFIRLAIKNSRIKRTNHYGVELFRSTGHREAIRSNEKFAFIMVIFALLFALGFYVLALWKHAF